MTFLLYNKLTIGSCSVLISSAFPFFFPSVPFHLQVGGLGDVVTSLSRAVQDLNHNVDIIFPKYDCLNLSSVSSNPWFFLTILYFSR